LDTISRKNSSSKLGFRWWPHLIIKYGQNGPAIAYLHCLHRCTICLTLRLKLSFLDKTTHDTESNQVGHAHSTSSTLQGSCSPKPCSVLDLNRRIRNEFCALMLTYLSIPWHEHYLHHVSDLENYVRWPAIINMPFFKRISP